MLVPKPASTAPVSAGSSDEQKDTPTEGAPGQLQLMQRMVRSALTGKVGRIGSGRPARLRVWMGYYLFVSNAAASRLLTFVSLDPSIYQDWSAFAALFESYRVHQVRMDLQVTHTSLVNHGDLIYIAPDVDGTTSPASVTTVASRVNEVTVYATDACTGHHQKHVYVYKVPRQPPYSNFVDTASPTSSGGVIQIASQEAHGVGDVAIKAYVRAEVEFCNRE